MRHQEHSLTFSLPPSNMDSKVEQVSEEAVALRLDLDRHTHRERRRAAEEADRADLLAGRASTAAWADAADADAAAEGAIRNSKRILEETFAIKEKLIRKITFLRMLRIPLK